MTAGRRDGEPAAIDPLTFEVLRNAFASAVDQMAEQILRTCHSFVIFARDFSSALCDAEGNTVAQGSGDLAGHVGTLHFTAKAVLETFGDDIHEGDVFLVNDPFLGGTHVSDVRVVRPIFLGGKLAALAQSCGHWSDVGGTVPGSFDPEQHEFFGLGVRITPLRIWSRGEYLEDVADLVLANVRRREDAAGDLQAQAQATTVCEQELHRLERRYGAETVVAALEQVQGHTERTLRRRIAALPDGVWEARDYIDQDPGRPEGLVPVNVKLTIAGNQMHFDLAGSGPTVRSLYNAAFGATFSAVIAGTKMFFPDIPLNSGFYRALTYDPGPPGTIVNAVAPAATSGMSMPYEKALNCAIAIWSRISPERAMACSFNIEYLQVGGSDVRRPAEPEPFVWYDWLVGGWGGRNGRDGTGATSAVFGPSLQTQPVEGQERLSPVLTTELAIATDSGGPGEFRGGVGVRKGGVLTRGEAVSLAYIGDRERAVVWGLDGGLPSRPHGLRLRGPGGERYLGTEAVNVTLVEGDEFSRPSAGGGGYGDPLRRDPAAVLEDVVEGYVSIARALADYGVVVREVDAELSAYELDGAATAEARERAAALREERLAADPAAVAARYRAGELSDLEVVRHHGVILDWGTGEPLAQSTREYRALLAESDRGRTA
jgi:N-methylhydantoinase B